MQYALKAKRLYYEFYSAGYYTGKSYIYQGGRYAVTEGDINKAKIYSSKARAEKASEMQFENYSFEVIELND